MSGVIGSKLGGAMDDVITINGVEYVKQGKVSKRTRAIMDYFYIDIPSFAERLGISQEKARIISRRRDLCDRGISITINSDNEKGGTRINWVKYVQYVETERPAVPEEMRVNSKPPVFEGRTAN